MRVRKLGSGDLFEVDEDLCNPVEASEPNSLQSEATVLGAGEAQQPCGESFLQGDGDISGSAQRAVDATEMEHHTHAAQWAGGTV